MKKYIYLGLLVMVVLVIAIVAGNGSITEDEVIETITEDIVTERITENSIEELIISSDFKTAIFQVDGMSCRSCALGVESELRQVNGVKDAKISYNEGTVTVVFDPTQIDVETIAQTSTAYPAKFLRFLD